MRKHNILRVLLVMTMVASSNLTAQSEPIHFVYYDQFEPFSWLDNDRMQGIFIDVINELFEERLGMSVRHEGAPWRRAQQMVRDGTADGMCTVATAERRQYALPAGTPVVSVNFRIFTSQANPDLFRLKQIRRISELDGLSLVDIAGSGWAATNLKGMDVYYAESYEQLFLMIKLGRADAAIRNDWQTLYLINKMGFSDDIAALPQAMTDEPIEYTILIGKKSSHSLSIMRIEAALREMKEDGSLLKILERYGKLPTE